MYGSTDLLEAEENLCLLSSDVHNEDDDDGSSSYSLIPLNF